MSAKALLYYKTEVWRGLIEAFNVGTGLEDREIEFRLRRRHDALAKSLLKAK
jgi:hypothetical protein